MMNRSVQYPDQLPPDEHHGGHPRLLHEVQNVRANHQREENRDGERANANGRIMFSTGVHRENFEDHCVNSSRTFTELI